MNIMTVSDMALISVILRIGKRFLPRKRCLHWVERDGIFTGSGWLSKALHHGDGEE